MLVWLLLFSMAEAGAEVAKAVVAAESQEDATDSDQTVVALVVLKMVLVSLVGNASASWELLHVKFNLLVMQITHRMQVDGGFCITDIFEQETCSKD